MVVEEEEERTPRPVPSAAEMSPRGYWSRLIAARCVLGVAHMVPPRVETCTVHCVQLCSCAPAPDTRHAAPRAYNVKVMSSPHNTSVGTVAVGR